MFFIYEHIRLDTKAVFYVGKGSKRRMHSKGRRNAYWNNIVRKAGGFTVREVCRHQYEELVFLAEQERIDQLKRLGVKLSNMTDGGEGPSGYRHTEETKKKIAELQMGEKHHAYGKPMLEHTKEALLKANKGRPLSEEHRKKVSEANKLRKNSPKTRSLISKAKQNGGHHMALTVEYDGKRFDCIKALCVYLNKPKGTVNGWIAKNPEKYGITVIGRTKDLK
jgi:hypothetical protein